MVLAFLVVFTAILEITIGLDTGGANSEVVVLRAVRGREARLPCGQGRVFLDGPEAYVLWLKNDRDTLYRFPNDETDRSVHRFLEDCPDDRCHDETALLIKRVSEQDEGLYRCRVHYQASPSIDYVIEVRLVDSPGVPRIYTEDGEEVKKGYVGPYGLGDDLVLYCEVNDDQPDTLVYWSRNGVVIERAHTARPGVLRADVRERNMTRDDLDAHYECAAQNADVSEPLSASVVVKMFLAPMSVEVRLNNNVDFEVGSPRVVDCVVVGCVPPPSVTWHLGDSPLRPSVHKELHEGNYTVSSLTLAPSLKDNGTKLSCRAHNSYLRDKIFDHSVQINVGFRPVCTLARVETLGVVVGQAETVSCIVEAAPAPLQFSWTFADSRTLYTSVQNVPGYTNRYTSSLTWVPRDGDEGQLLCRAANTFGEQRRACPFELARGGPPAQPDCVVLRAYPKSIRVQCKKGWDGGRPQTISLEVHDTQGRVLHNASNELGLFVLSDVTEEENLTAVVYATSFRGKSSVKELHLATLGPLVATAASIQMHPSWTRWVEVAGGVAIIILLVTMVFIVTKLMKNGSDPELNPDLVPRVDGIFHREPDFIREERVLGTTNITVNQLRSCSSQYSALPGPTCRVLVGCPPSPDICSTSQSYFV